MPLYGKILEVRDRNTFIPVMAVMMWHPAEPAAYYLKRCGYGPVGTPVLLTRLDGRGQALVDPFEWGDRTMHIAHLAISRLWHTLGDGSVIDVEFELKETKKPKESERFGP